MRRFAIKGACLATFLLICYTIPVVAQGLNPIKLALHERWATFRDEASCYAGTSPDFSNAQSAKSEAYFKAARPREDSYVDVIAFYPGFDVRPGSYITFKIDEDAIAFPARDDPWAIWQHGSPATWIIDRLRAGSKLTITARERGSARTYELEFYLDGFSDAFDHALRACGLFPPPAAAKKPKKTPTVQEASIATIGQSSEAAAQPTAQQPDWISEFIRRSYEFKPFFMIWYPVIGLAFLFVGYCGYRLASKTNKPSSQSSNPPATDPTYSNISSAATIPPQPSPQPFSNSGPVKGMALKRKRHQRKGSFGTTIFTLDARMEVSAENRALIATYKLGDHVIYESANREKYAARARQHAENTRDQPGLLASPGAQAWGFAKTLGRIGAAVFNATASALSLRITVNSLIEGVHVESKSMEEILEAEEAIKDAAANLKAYLETSTTFSGQEEIIDL